MCKKYMSNPISTVRICIIYKTKVEYNTKIMITFDICFQILVCLSERLSSI